MVHIVNLIPIKNGAYILVKVSLYIITVETLMIVKRHKRLYSGLYLFPIRITLIYLNLYLNLYRAFNVTSLAPSSEVSDAVWFSVFIPLVESNKKIKRVVSGRFQYS